MNKAENKKVIVAIAPCCGLVVFGAANLKGVADPKEIGEMAIAGFSIAHWPVEDFRVARWCECPKKEGPME